MLSQSNSIHGTKQVGSIARQKKTEGTRLPLDRMQLKGALLGPRGSHCPKESHQRFRQDELEIVKVAWDVDSLTFFPMFLEVLYPCPLQILVSKGHGPAANLRVQPGRSLDCCRPAESTWTVHSEAS